MDAVGPQRPRTRLRYAPGLCSARAYRRGVRADRPAPVRAKPSGDTDRSGSATRPTTLRYPLRGGPGATGAEVTVETHRLAALCFADIAGYTELSATDEGEAIALVRLFQEV